MLKGYTVGDMTYKVHLDSDNLVPYLTRQTAKSPRVSFFYVKDLLLHHVSGGIIARMGSGRISQTEADLFSTASPRGAPSPAANPPRNAALTTDIATARSTPRYLLPKDLSAGIRQLTDQEFDRLLRAVLIEQKRRGRRLPGSGKTSRKSPIKEIGPALPLAKLNAIRAAFKAGVAPSHIARQFGISRADVRMALSSGTSKRVAR